MGSQDAGGRERLTAVDALVRTFTTVHLTVLYTTVRAVTYSRVQSAFSEYMRKSNLDYSNI